MLLDNNDNVQGKIKYKLILFLKIKNNKYDEKNIYYHNLLPYQK